MQRLRSQISSSTAGIVTGLAGLLALSAVPARAWATEPCAVVESFGGVVQLLDPSRTRMIDLAPKMGLECGSWISTSSGALHFRHKDGHRISVGENSFVSISDKSDHVVLYRGRLLAEAGTGSGELTVVTANARARFLDSTGVIVFNEQEEESQLVSVERSSVFENRFSDTKKIRVRQGEVSALNFKLLRVIPSAPRAVSMASLKEIMAGLHLATRTQEVAIRTAEKRQNRKIASFPVVAAGPDASDYGDQEKKAEIDKAKLEEQATYMRHQPSAMDQELKSHWVGKFTGGSSLGKKFTARGAGNVRKKGAAVQVIDLGRAPASKKFVRPSDTETAEDEEKQKLIDELKQLENH